MRMSELDSAFGKATDYLSYSPRSAQEIRKYLAGKGYDKDIVDETMTKLVSYRYIDDEAYAVSYIRSRSKKYGEFRIASELKAKGIAADLIKTLLEEQEESAATDVARKYIASHRNADKQKLRRFLAGRGFSWDDISDAVSTLDGEGIFDTEEDSDE